MNDDCNNLDVYLADDLSADDAARFAEHLARAATTAATRSTSSGGSMACCTPARQTHRNCHRMMCW